LSLADIAAGRRVRVVGITAGKQLARRLLGLGLRANVELEVLQRGGGGAVVVRQGQGRVALGAGMASKILVVSSQ
jgi:ferrous iron transport protein A